MRLSEKVDHLLRQYNYKRKRESNNRASNSFQIEEYFSQVDAYIDEVMEEFNKFLPKR